MALSISLNCFIVLLSAQTAVIGVTVHNKLSLVHKVKQLKEFAENLIKENNETSKQLDILSKELLMIKTFSEMKVTDLEHKLSISNECLKHAVKKIEAWRGTLQKSQRHALEDFEMEKFDHQNVPRFLLQNDTNSVAFSVVMDTHKENLQIHQTLKFDRIITNDGNGYDQSTSIFRAPASGLYFFSVVITSHASEDIETEIVRNGNAVVNTYSGDSTTWNQGTQSAVLHLSEGDNVYIRMLNNPGVNNGNIRVFGYGWSSFSGFLISK